MRQIGGGLRPLPLQPGHLDFLRSGTVGGFIGHGLGGLLGGGGLSQLGGDFGAVSAHQDRPDANRVAFLDEYFGNPGSHFRGNVGFQRFHLSLEHLGRWLRGAPQPVSQQANQQSHHQR